METLAERVRIARKRAGLSTRELSRRLGFSPGYISQIERGVMRTLTTETGERLAEILGIDPAYLLGIAETGSGGVPSRSPADLLRAALVSLPIEVPVLRTPVRAGNGEVPETDIVGHEYVEQELRGRRLFALIVQGECLEPLLTPGDRVIYEEHAAFQSGDLVVAVHDALPVVKFAVQVGETWELRSYHEEPLRVNGETRVYGPVLRIVRQAPKWRGERGGVG